VILLLIDTEAVYCEVDADKVKAEFKKGVLAVTLPKTPRAIKETKKITVKAE